jgi:prevent-host-death family protein
MRVTTRDLRFYTKELLAMVDSGEEVIITYKGKPCAKLIPIQGEETDSNSPVSLFGIWEDNTRVEQVEEYVRTLRKGRFSDLR